MNLVDGAVIGAVCGATIGIMRLMIQSKINRVECELKHANLQKEIEGVKKDSREDLAEVKKDTIATFIRVEDTILEVKKELIEEIRRINSVKLLRKEAKV